MLQNIPLVKNGNVDLVSPRTIENGKLKLVPSKDFDLSFMCLSKFPEINTDSDTASTIKLIDVLWYQKGTNNVIAAFEVEKSTSIYSGILRLTDLSYSIADGDEIFYLIVPDKREKDVCIQLLRPAIKGIKTKINYILFSDLRKHCDGLCRFGENHLAMEKIAKSV